MIKRKVRKQAVSIILGIFFIIPIIAFVFLASKGLQTSGDYPTYVNESTINDVVPVISSTKKIIKPFADLDVVIAKDYYDYKADEEKQVDSIVVHDNTYIQNNGIDYSSNKIFDVIAVLEGTVLNVKEDDITGKTIEVKNNDGYVVIYQSLSEVNVKKGDIISQGQELGKSGENELDKEIGNHLHFEVYNNGQSINPQIYLEREVNIKEN